MSPPLLYLDQSYLSGFVKRKPAFVALESAVRAGVDRGAVAVPESAAHRLESAPRPDLPLLAFLRELSRGLRLPDEPDAADRERERRLRMALDRDFPQRQGRASDAVDLRALAMALPRCHLVTCDAFMADLVRRTRLDLRHGCELFTGRRADVGRLRTRLEALPPTPVQERDADPGPGTDPLSRPECGSDGRSQGRRG